VIVGFSFGSDIDMFMRGHPQLNFYRYIRRFIDAQNYYARVWGAPVQTGLSKVADKVLDIQMCKREQISNWDRRPLRQSQLHYAYLDAQILVPLIKVLSEEGKEKGYPIEKSISYIDKRGQKPPPEKEEFDYGDEED